MHEGYSHTVQGLLENMPEDSVRKRQNHAGVDRLHSTCSALGSVEPVSEHVKWSRDASLQHETQINRPRIGVIHRNHYTSYRPFDLPLFAL